MPSILEDVLEFRSLHEPPWGCYVARKGASRLDIDFWVKRRGFQIGTSNAGRRIYGLDLDEERNYDIVPPSSTE
jgi:hypothetical protein